MKYDKENRESVSNRNTQIDKPNLVNLENLEVWRQESARMEKELNNCLLQVPEDHSKGKHYDKHIFENLPDVLRYGCDILTDKTEKEVFLVGALGVASGILPNVRGFYDGNYVTPHLYVYVLGKYGTGKGSLKYAKMLGKGIHHQKKNDYERLKSAYQQELAEYENEVSLFKKGKIQHYPTKPEKPGQKLLYIPANISKSGLTQLLQANKNRGIIFETEGDTLTDALKQDYANFSSILRDAFHHDATSYYRKTDSEFIEIENTELAIVLSSTHDQRAKLIPSVENGLFSRFLWYELQASSKFRNVFDRRKNDYPAKFEELSGLFLKIYNDLSESPVAITVSLTEDQQEKFLETFQEWAINIQDYVSDDLQGSVNRLGLICFRVAMIFTVLRHFEGQRQWAEEITCEDKDFEIALKIVTILKRQALKVFYSMPEGKAKNDKPDIDQTLKIRARELSQQGMSYGDISKELRKPKTTVYRWLNS